MDTVTFTPVLTDLYATLAGCSAIIVVMVYLAVRAGNRKEADPRKRVLLPMLAYFGALLALMALLGSFWSILKYPTVTLSATELIVGDTAYPRPNLNNVRMTSVGPGVNISGRVLLIQTKDRKNWAFPDDRYDIRHMYGLLRGPE